jgi:hypothetical protein
MFCYLGIEFRELQELQELQELKELHETLLNELIETDKCIQFHKLLQLQEL